MVTVSSALWHAGTTPCGHFSRHCSQVIPEKRTNIKNKKAKATIAKSCFNSFEWEIF